MKVERLAVQRHVVAGKLHLPHEPAPANNWWGATPFPSSCRAQSPRVEAYLYFNRLTVRQCQLILLGGLQRTVSSRFEFTEER